MNAETLMLLGGVGAFVLTLYWVRSRDLREKYAAIWVVIAALLLLCGLFPGALMAFAERAHLSYAAAVLFLALAVGYVFLFSVSLSLTRQYRRNLRLLQEVALLQHRLRLLEEKLQPQKAAAEAPAPQLEEHPPAPGPQPEMPLRRGGKLRRALLLVTVLALTLAPPAYMLWIVATTGADNPSNDLLATAPVVDRVLSGTYQWTNLPRDCFLAGGHFMLLPVLVRLVVAAAFHWDIYYELYVAFFFACLKLVLLHQAFAHGTSRGCRLVLWPVLSVLVFSLSQLNVFTFADAGLTLQMTQAGVALGLWGLVRYQGDWRGAALAGLGGVAACYSSGTGPLAWPVFLAGMVMLGYRRAGPYLLCLAAAALGCLPYLYFRLTLPVPSGQNEQIGVWFSIPLYLQALGWPFVIGWDIGQAERAGTLGAALGLLGSVILWWRGRSAGWRSLAPGLMLLAYGLMNIWLIGKFRGPALAPWYTTTFLLYWVGLIGLAYAAWAAPANPPARPDILCTFFWVACLAVLARLLLASNLTYEDKAYYLYSRAPVSASTLRHYHTAPTYAEGYVFQWGVGRRDEHPDEVAALGRILERRGLSVFAPHQRWALQGDWVLDSVRLSEADEAPEVAWRDGDNPAPQPFSHYKHLDLFLHPPNAVHWQVRLPADLEHAFFDSAVTAEDLAEIPGGAECELRVQPAGGESRLLWSHRLAPGQMSWVPCRVSLAEYAGQDITLHLACRPVPDAPPTGALWRFPVIDLALTGSTPPADDDPVLPANTDLSPFQPRPSRTDPDLLAQGLAGWEARGMEKVPGRPGAWRLGKDPYLVYGPPGGLPLKEYSHAFFRVAVPERLGIRYCRLWLYLDTQSEPRVAEVPLLPDGRMHTYTFDLKLLGIERPARLMLFRFDPVHHLGDVHGLEVEVAGLGFIRKRPEP